MSKFQILWVVLFQHLHFLALKSNVLDNRVLRLMGSSILSLETIAVLIRSEALGIDGILNIVRIGVVSKGNIFLIIITQITIERFAWHKKITTFQKLFGACLIVLAWSTSLVQWLWSYYLSRCLQILTYRLPCPHAFAWYEWTKQRS